MLNRRASFGAPVVRFGGDGFRLQFAQVSTGVTLYLVSACGSAEEFVAAFRRYADRTGLFIPSGAPLPAGRRGRLALTLKDGGVMIEGEAEILQSSVKPTVLHGRPGMTIKFVEPDEVSKVVIAELEKARLAMKPAPPSVPPRPTTLPPEPRPVVPTVGGRIDAANALAECVVIGDIANLVDTASSPRSINDGGSGKSKFIVPSIPAVGTPRANTPSTPPPSRPITPSSPPPVGASLESARPRTPSVPPDPASKPLPAPSGKMGAGSRLTSIGFPALDKAPAFPPKTNVPGVTPDNPLLSTQLGTKAPPNRTKEFVAADNPLLSTQLGTPGSDRVTNATTMGMLTSVNEEATSIGEVPPPPRAVPVAEPGAPPKKKTDPMPAATPAASSPPAAPAPTPNAVAAAAAKASRPTSIGFPAMRTPFETQALGVVKPPTPPVVPGDSASAKSGGAPGPRGKSATRPPLTPRHPTPVAPVPIVRPPAKAAPQVADAIVESAIVEEEKTDLSDIPQAPFAHASTVDASVDPLAQTLSSSPQRSGGMRASESLAAIPSDDWTMSPDASGPTVLPNASGKAPVVDTEPTPAPGIAPKGPLTGNWSISLDPEAGWGEPVKLAQTEAAPQPAPQPKAKPKRERQPGQGNPDKAISDEKGFTAVEWEDKPTGIGEAKIEIDSTLMEPLKPMPSLDDDDDDLDASPSASAPRLATSGGVRAYVTPPAGLPAAPAGPSPFAAPPPYAPPAPSYANAVLAGPASSPYPAAPVGAQSLSGANTGAFANAAPPAAQGLFAGYGAQPQTEGSAAARNTGEVAALERNSQYPVISAPQADYAGGATAGVAPSAARRKRAIIIGIGAVVALAAGFVLVLLLVGGKSNKPKAGTGKAGSGSSHAVVIDHGSDVVTPAGSGSAAIATGSDTGSATPAVGSGSADVVEEPAGSGSGSAVAAVDTPVDAGTEIVAPVAGGPCKIAVTSVPSGADVYEAETKLGTTPASFDLPCGVEAKLTLRKAKYINTGKSFTPAEGKANKLAVKLAKPTFTVKVTSTPAGATITVGGRSLGVTPASIRLPAYETAAIIVSKPGYVSDSKTIAPKSNNSSHHVTLKKGRR